MTRLMLALALAAGFALPLRAQEPVTTVIVVRHTERVDQNTDSLSAAGEARAQALARVLADARIAGIVTTQYRRSALTAAPAMAAFALTPVIVQAGGRDMAAHGRAVADAVRQFAGRTVLVIGHSNTVGPIIAALGGPTIERICDNEHAHLFVVTLRASEVSLIRSRYGAEDPAGPPCR